VRSIRLLVLRLVRENPSRGYRRIHGELFPKLCEQGTPHGPGIKIAAPTVWEILATEGIDPAPDRRVTTWADFPRSQADALLPALSDQVLADSGTQIALSGIRAPRMNSTMERRVQTRRHELLDRTLIRNENHPRHTLREFETHHAARPGRT
jgi:hypothetical protein